LRSIMRNSMVTWCASWHVRWRCELSDGPGLVDGLKNYIRIYLLLRKWIIILLVLDCMEVHGERLLSPK
jgi:hypothetical protein